MKYIMPIFMALALLGSVSSCYRMPTEDDYRLVPVTNNPNITREKNNSLIPSVGY